MTEPTKVIEILWRGPFAWPGFEAEACLPTAPRTPGVYIQAFECDQGFVIYGAGITKRPVAVRLREHARRYLSGEYTVLDVEAARGGERKEVWHGWGYARAHRDEFEARKLEIQNAARRQLAAFRIFVSDPEVPVLGLRLRERLEAAIMESLYRQPEPFRDLPDRGMFLAPRRSAELPVHARSTCDAVLHGLPGVMLL